MVRTFKLALRSLLARPARTLLTAFGIVLGVAVILAVNITNLSTLDSINSIFTEASGRAHLVVNSSNTNGAGFAESIARELANAPDVQAAIPSLHVETVLGDDTRTAHSAGYLGIVGDTLSLYGIDPLVDRTARDYKIVEGRFLAINQSAQELVLVKDYADEKKLKVGRDIQILTPDGLETVRLVGLMSKEGPGRLNNGAFGIIPLRAAQTLFYRMGDLDQVDIVAAPQATGSAGLDALKEALQTQLGGDYTVTYPATQGRRVTQMLDTYQLGLTFFSVIAIFVGAFLIYNTFSMTVAERTREIGMLRTIGMTRLQVMGQILGEASLLGMAGSCLGVLTGIGLSFLLVRGMELLIAQDLRITRIPVDSALACGLLGLAVTLVAAGFPAWQAGFTSPLEAVRSRGTRRENWLARHGWWLGCLLLALTLVDVLLNPLPAALQARGSYAAIVGLFAGASLLMPATVGFWESISRPVIRLIYGDEGRLGSRNLRRARLRTALTVSALMVSSAMILGVRGMTQAFEHDIRAWADQSIGGDLYIYSSLRMPLELGRRIAAVEGVQALAATRSAGTTWLTPDGKRERLTFSAVDPAAYRQVASFVFADSQGDPEGLLDQLAGGETVFLSTTLAEKYKLKQGDTIALQTKRGMHAFVVAAAVVDFSNHGLVVEGSWKDLDQYFGVRDADAFLVKVQPGVAPAAVQKLIDDQYGVRRHLTIQSNTQVKAQAVAGTTQAFAFFDVLALIAVIVATLGIINTLSMNVIERTQELGMLRGVGMSPQQLGKMVLAESSLMGLIGGMFGLALGLVLTRVLLTNANTLQGYHIQYVLPTQGILISLAIALFVSQVAAIGPARRAGKMRIAEAIQFE